MANLIQKNDAVAGGADGVYCEAEGEGVSAVFHYLPMNKSAYALQMADSGWRMAECRPSNGM
jgi:hypothetical protein